MRKGLTLLETIFVIAIIAVLIGLLIPAIQKIRESAQMLQSHNNMKQIVLGFAQLAATNEGQLPGTVDSAGAYQSEAFIELLPVLEQSNLYQFYFNPSSDSDWSESNMQIATYINPLDRSFGSVNQAMRASEPDTIQTNLSISSYALNDQFFEFSPDMRLLTDGSSQTIWLAEHYGWNCNNTTFIYPVGACSPWQPKQPPTFARVIGRPAPGDYYPITTGSPPESTAADGKTFQLRPRVSDCDPRLPNASSSCGLQSALADGSVRILAPSVSPQIFWGMVTPSGGEVIPLGD